jgi:hypothetical protein
VGDTCIWVTQHGPEKPWKLELIKDNGAVMLDFILPPAFSIDPPWTIFTYSNFPKVLIPQVIIDIKLVWDTKDIDPLTQNTRNSAIAELVEDIDLYYY